MNLDKQLDHNLKTEEALIIGAGEINKRSSWDVPAELQIFRVAQEGDGKIEGSVEQFFTHAHHRLGGSQITEEAFHRQKNGKPLANRKITIENSYLALLEPPLASTKHDYIDVRLPPRPVGRDLRLPEKAFKVAVKTQPKELFQITSFQDKATWWSPRAEAWGVPFVDQALREKAYSRGQQARIQHAWLGQIVSTSRDIVIRRAGPAEA